MPSKDTDLKEMSVKRYRDWVRARQGESDKQEGDVNKDSRPSCSEFEKRVGSEYPKHYHLTKTSSPEHDASALTAASPQ
jgi:hypothetical protein